MKLPEKGFYYHFRHDSSKGVNDCAYEMIGTAFSTESTNVHGDDPALFLKDEVVLYRPLYKESIVFKSGRDFWYRPISMFEEMVTKEGKTFPRFQKITDPEIIAKLADIRDQMYK
jgi:hypothetical protein